MRAATPIAIPLCLLLAVMTGCSEQPPEVTGPPNLTLWTVRPDGSGNFTDIQPAVNAATNGDTILVGPGHYTSLHEGFVDGVPRVAVFIVIAKRLTIVGEAGPESTIVGDVSTTDFAIACTSASGSISGFGIRGGGNGGVFLFLSNVTFSGNEVTGATTAVLCKKGHPVVATNTITGNNVGISAVAATITTDGNTIEGSTQRGISCTQGTDATLSGDLVTGSGEAGLSVTESDATVSRLLIADGSSAAVLAHASQLTIDESTISRNAGSGFILSGTSRLAAERVILALSGSCAIQLSSVADSATVACSDVWGNGAAVGAPCITPVGNGNFALDPLFCDGAGGDYTLKAGSPCAPANSGACAQVGAFPVGCP